jgi:hypothetical protein
MNSPDIKFNQSKVESERSENDEIPSNLGVSGEILEPTLKNLKRMELKNQRKDL